MIYLSVVHTKSKQFRVLEVNCYTQTEEDIEHWRKLLQLPQPGHNRKKCALFVIDSQKNAHNRYLLEPPQQHYQQPQLVLFHKSPLCLNK